MKRIISIILTLITLLGTVAVFVGCKQEEIPPPPDFDEIMANRTHYPIPEGAETVDIEDEDGLNTYNVITPEDIIEGRFAEIIEADPHANYILSGNAASLTEPYRSFDFQVKNFYGIFNGNNYQITIRKYSGNADHKPPDPNTMIMKPLFEYIHESAVIKNIILTEYLRWGVFIPDVTENYTLYTTGEGVGFLNASIAYINFGVIRHCINTYPVVGYPFEAYSDAGGIAANNLANSRGEGGIEDCLNYGAVSGYYASGIACGGGYVKNCYNMGIVRATYYGAGITIESKRISNCVNYGDIYGASKVGGICVYDPKETVNCKNYGKTYKGKK